MASPASHNQHTNAPTQLPRRLGLWSSVAVVVGLTIGSGIFRTPAMVATKLPGTLPMLGVWIIGGIVALCGAMSLSEASSAYPETGGPYVYIRNAFGRLPAFLFGWAQLSMISAAGAAGIATAFAEYFLRVIGVDPHAGANEEYVHYVAAAAVVIVGAINYVGVKWSSMVLNVLTLIKFIALAVIVVGAFAIGLPRTGGHFTPVAPAGSYSAAPLGVALVAILWAYDGWGELAYLSGEVENPNRNLPLGLILGTASVATLYVLANLAYLSVLSVDEISASKLVAADVASRLVGPVGVTLVSMTVVVSTFGALNASMLTSPRSLFAMADDRLLFKKVASVHPRFQTPYVAVAVTTVLGVALVMVQTFEQLADTFVTAILPFYALAVASLFVFRRRGVHAPFKTPLYPLVPAIFIAATLYLLASALIDPSSRNATLGVFAVTLVGIPIYYFTVARGGSSPAVKSALLDERSQSGRGKA